MNTARKKQPGISPRQIKIIHTIKGKLGLDDDAYRLLLGRYNVTTSKRLSWRQAEELIEDLNRQTGHKTEARIPSPESRKLRHTELEGRPGMCSGKQARMIEAMWAEVSRATTAEDREHALWVFLRRITGVDHFRFLKSWQVEKVVKALTEMKSQKEAK